ncbi:MAG: alkaline phosphatase family protein, partial [Mycobacteriales bacterium]
SFVTPNLCDDGHDTGCAGTDVAGDKTGNLTAVQHWLSRYVPPILASPAFKKDGLLLVTWDEAAATTGSDGAADSSACCDERTLNTPDAGGASTDLSGIPALSGKGGGRVGAIAVSPYIAPGTVSTRPYNHYSTLRTLSDLFHVRRLGYAAQDSGVQSFGADVFTRRTASAPAVRRAAPVRAVTADAGPGSALVGLPSTGLGLELPAAALALLLGSVAVRRRVV